MVAEGLLSIQPADTVLNTGPSIIVVSFRAIYFYGLHQVRERVNTGGTDLEIARLILLKAIA